MPTIRSAGFSRLLLALTYLLVAGRVSAGPISVTSGYVDLGPFSGPLLLAGERGFTFHSRMGRTSGFIFALNCNDDPLRCLPGTTLNVGIRADTSELGGAATLDGVTHTGLSGPMSPESIAIEITGSLVLPALAPTAVATAPFTLTGTFAHTVSGGARGHARIAHRQRHRHRLPESPFGLSGQLVRHAPLLFAEPRSPCRLALRGCWPRRPAW